MKRHDLLPKLRRQLLDASGSPAQLMFAPSVTFNMSTDALVPKVVNGAVTVVDPMLGIVEYAWVPGDTDTAGTFVGEFAVVFDGGLEQTYPNNGYIKIVILPDLS